MSDIAALVRRADPDRYLAALFAPAAKRPLLFALYAFNIEIARVADTVREPMLGEIRLEWWRETILGARAGKPRAQDTARALAGLFASADLPLAPFEAMIAARSFDSSSGVFADRAALEDYCDATSGNLMRLAARILGAPDDGLARTAGTAYAIAGILRSVPHHAARHKTFLPQSLLDAIGLAKDDVFVRHERDKAKAVVAQMAHCAREHFAIARATRVGRAELPAYLPAALVPSFLARVTRRNFDPLIHTPDVSIHRRQLSLLAAALRGRL
jgi:15-cis-phytoene synthase